MRTARSTRRRPVSPARTAETAAKREQVLSQLADGIEALSNSEEWQRYLTMQAKFHRYSFGNVILILMQYPDATQVASFRKWQELGRQVRKGEHGIRIWAPHTRKTSDADDESITTDGESRDDGTPRIGFHLVSVFDISQTDGDDLAADPTSLLDGEDEAGLFARLAAVAESLGFGVQVAPEIDGHPGSNGLCEFGPRVITVAGNRTPAQRAKSLAHEIGHAILHAGAAAPRGLRVLEAESVAYVVCTALGLDTAGYSLGYILGWQDGDAATAREAIEASGKAIQSAASKILAAVGGQAPGMAVAS
jgi:N-terminal domain of anti-restriction factor ArdC/IrrE N-terminal-like domain